MGRACFIVFVPLVPEFRSTYRALQQAGLAPLPFAHEGDVQAAVSELPG